MTDMQASSANSTDEDNYSFAGSRRTRSKKNKQEQRRRSSLNQAQAEAIANSATAAAIPDRLRKLPTLKKQLSNEGAALFRDALDGATSTKTLAMTPRGTHVAGARVITMSRGETAKAAAPVEPDRIFSSIAGETPSLLYSDEDDDDGAEEGSSPHYKIAFGSGHSYTVNF